MNEKINTILNKIMHIFAIVTSLVLLGYSIFTAIQRRYPLFGLSWLWYMQAHSVLVKYCEKALKKLPPTEKSLRKFLLKLALCLLYSGVTLPLVIMAAPFYGPLAAGLLYAMPIGGSIFLFYIYMIHDCDGAAAAAESCSDREEDHALVPVDATVTCEGV